MADGASSSIEMIRSTLLTLLICCLCAAAVNPGLQLAITEKGLKYVADVGIPLLIEQLKTATIPPMSGRADTPVGHFDYDLSNIKLQSFAIPTYSLTSVHAVGLQLQASRMSASVHADWHYREESWPHVSDSGSADISMSSSSLKLSLALGRDTTNNHFTIETTGCSINIGHLSVDFHGGASWLYNLFNDQIADSLKDSLVKSLCSTADQYIDTSGKAAVESIPIVAKIDSTSEINYELISDPDFQPAYIQTQHKGEFYSIAKPVEAPITAPPIPPATSVDYSKMMYVWVSTYVVNSAAFVYRQSGILAYNITPSSSLPPGVSINTDFFGAFIPELSKRYPHMDMVLDITAGQYPEAVVANNTISLNVPGTLVAMVKLPNNTLTTVFTLGLLIFTKAQVTLASRSGVEVIGFQDTLLSIDIKLISSEIGTFDVNSLQKSLQLIATYVIIPDINNYGTNGIPVPTVSGLSFVDPVITLGNNYIQIATDVNFKPSIFA
ncbi:bactericidal permeability-increasing protein-like isoform X2 [Dysidea avara]|uniref:bactericidal permeability-increasing protein-like isoform X2 n=1 Tax=Dysidea avara TaxID=196820 RepID=UPI00332F0E4A